MNATRLSTSRIDALPTTLRAKLSPVTTGRPNHIGHWDKSQFLLQREGSSYCSLLSAINGLQFAGIRQRAYFSQQEAFRLFLDALKRANAIHAREGKPPVEQGGSNSFVTEEALDSSLQKLSSNRSATRIMVHSAVEFTNGTVSQTFNPGNDSTEYFYSASLNFPLPLTSIQHTGFYHAVTIPWIDWEQRVLYISDQVAPYQNNPNFMVQAYSFDELATHCIESKRLVVYAYETFASDYSKRSVRETIAGTVFPK